MNAIEVHNLNKSYDGKIKALNNINFSVQEGSIVGFLGPNGSGKTTTVRILNGILLPTGGEAYILGKNIVKDSKDIHRLSGVMTESASCYENLTANENLLFFGRMHGMEERLIKKRSLDLLERLELKEAGNKKVKEFSTGMRKRICLAIALIHNPKVLFLDEPTSGLDPENAQNVTKLIKDMAFENKSTVFMCTHQLKYAEDICTQYTFINQGRILGSGNFDELSKAKKIKDHIMIRGENIPSINGFKKLPSVGKLKGSIYKKEIEGDEETSNILKIIIENGGKIYEAKRERCSLEELYFIYVRGDKIE